MFLIVISVSSESGAMINHILPDNFFFKGSGHHRDLHSFPTRRSSDLRPRARACESVRPLSDRSGPVAAVTCPTTARSEEHTSELQSRENLVCRLLLEKKKNLVDRSRP